MEKKKLLWQIYPSYLLIIVVCVVGIGWYVSRVTYDFYIHEVQEELVDRAKLIGFYLKKLSTPINELSAMGLRPLEPPKIKDNKNKLTENQKEALINQNFLESHQQNLDSLCRELNELLSTDTIIILPSGRAIGGLKSNSFLLNNYLELPEIKRAKKNNIGVSIRFSERFNREVMYVALLIKGNYNFLLKCLISKGAKAPLTPQKTKGTESNLNKNQKESLNFSEIPKVIDNEYVFIRTSKPLTSFFIQSRKIKILFIVIFVILFSFGLCFLVSEKIVKSIKALTEGVKHFASGNLKSRISLPSDASLEFHLLATALKDMANELNIKIHQLAQQANELKIVLSSMQEGVIALDLDKRVMFLNEAASKLFKVDVHWCVGRSFEEIIRDVEVQKLVSRAISKKTPEYGEVEIKGNAIKKLLVHITPLESIVSKTMIGVVLVFNDITKIHQAEEIRKDFVANVSHELRTPITSIKGAAETLFDMWKSSDIDESERFFEIILRNIDRIENIVKDLLTLAQLEKCPDRYTIEFEELSVFLLLKRALDVVAINAEKRDINIILSCKKDITIKGNSYFLEQAIINLIDNAIKYSPPKSKISINAMEIDDKVIIQVIDNGYGIPKEHLPRIFERFYRVDKRRSRDKGGTGLGLAIVKHVAYLHGGKAEVESVVGKGSTFSIILPK